MMSLIIKSDDPKVVSETLRHYADFLERDPHHFSSAATDLPGIRPTLHVAFTSDNCDGDRESGDCRCKF